MMKNNVPRTIWTAAMMMVGVLMGVHTHGQGTVSVNPGSTTAGQSITMILTGTNTNFTAVTGLWLRHSTQSATVYQGLNYTATNNVNATANFSIPPNAPLGNYHLQTYGGFNALTNALNVGVGPGSNYGQVSGKVIMDNNGNCVEDVGDQPYANAIVTLMPGPIYLTTGAQGDFSAWVPLGNYTLTTNVGGCGAYTCPSNGQHTANLPTSLSTDTGNDFYFQPGICADLHTGLNGGIFRPGFTVVSYVNFGNYGSTTVSNAVGTLVLPSTLTFVSANPAPSTINGNTLTWNFASMPAGFNQMITYQVTVPANTPLGTSLTFNSSIPAIGNDPNLTDNNVTRTMIVQGSSDPNDKRVWDQAGNWADGPVAPSTSRLSYMIRFQNTGTDTAFNIIVRDTLSSHLNVGSLRITGASHPVQLQLSGANKAAFIFPNIMLVDSFHNEPLSHGFVSFDIDLNPGVPVGTTISNRASNYFDFNAGVLTNYTHTTLCDFLSPSFTSTATGLQMSFASQTSTTATTWTWDFGDGGTANVANPSHTYAAPGTYVVCLTVANACRTESFCDTITTCSPPSAAFASSVTGAAVDFTDQSSPTVTTWAWDFGDGGTSSLQNPQHTYGSSGTFTVCLTVTDACSSATSCTTVVVCMPTNESFSYAAGPVLNVDFTATADPSVTSWSWDLGDGNTSSVQNPSHTYAVDGNYQVCLTVSNTCSTHTTCSTVGLVAVTTMMIEDMTVGPNPSEGVFMLSAGLLEQGLLEIEVFDAAGKVVWRREMQASAGTLRERIDLSDAADGLYFLRLRLEGQVQTLRLQKQ